MVDEDGAVGGIMVDEDGAVGGIITGEEVIMTEEAAI